MTNKYANIEAQFLEFVPLEMETLTREGTVEYRPNFISCV